jgi:hypothetical protein
LLVAVDGELQDPSGQFLFPSSSTVRDGLRNLGLHIATKLLLCGPYHNTVGKAVARTLDLPDSLVHLVVLLLFVKIDLLDRVNILVPEQKVLNGLFLVGATAFSHTESVVETQVDDFVRVSHFVVPLLVGIRFPCDIIIPQLS